MRRKLIFHGRPPFGYFMIAKAVEKYLLEEVPDLDRVIVHVDPEVEAKKEE